MAEVMAEWYAGFRGPVGREIGPRMSEYYHARGVDFSVLMTIGKRYTTAPGAKELGVFGDFLSLQLHAKFLSLQKGIGIKEAITEANWTNGLPKYLELLIRKLEPVAP